MHCFNLLSENISCNFVLHQSIYTILPFQLFVLLSIGSMALFLIFLLLHSTPCKHIIRWLTEVMRDCYCCILDGYCWTSGLFI